MHSCRTYGWLAGKGNVCVGVVCVCVVCCFLLSIDVRTKDEGTPCNPVPGGEGGGGDKINCSSL